MGCFLFQNSIYQQQASKREGKKRERSPFPFPGKGTKIEKWKGKDSRGEGGERNNLGEGILNQG